MSSSIADAIRNTHKVSGKIALVAGALAIVAGGALPAVAVDRQASEAQLDDAGNRQAAGAYAYDFAPAPHRSGPYASARSDQPATPARPHKDFQDYK